MRERALLAEYADLDALLAGIARLRGAGYTRLEIYSPYPIPVVDRALERPPSRLPWVVFVVGVAGAAGAYGLQWLLNAYLYPLDVGGRPPHLPVAFVPITFEMGILFAATTALLGVIVLGRLLRLWDPVFDAEGFETATADRFWLEVGGDDPRFDRPAIAAIATETGASRISAGGEP